MVPTLQEPPTACARSWSPRCVTCRSSGQHAKWIYTLGDAVLGAFAVCFVQSPSFLAHQRAMQRRKGQNNAPSLFGIDRFPSAPQIRKLLARSPSNWRRPSGGASSS